MGSTESIKKKLIVIGNGMAGARTVEEILARGGAEQFEITVFGEEPYGNYNRILLSNVLNGSQDSSEIFLNGLGWYQENGIALRAGVRVDVIARPHKAIHCDDGNWYPYDKLLIATGSRPSIPPIAALRKPNGEFRPGVFVFRTLDDCRKIAEYAAKCRRAVVIGGGLLGLEAARGLINHGVDVHVIHLLGHLMEQQLDPQAGAILKHTIEAMDIQVHLKKLTKAALGENEIIGLAFEDGSTLDCDMIVIATGITPNSEMGSRWGLTTERGIVVDDQMRTSDSDIYAVGECAQHRGRVYGLVAPLWEQAKVLAGHITGADREAAYAGSKIATKLKVMGIELASMGVIAEDGEHEDVVQFMEPKRGVYKKLIIRDGRLVGGILMGDISKAAYLMQAFDRGIRLPEERLSLLFDTGAPSARATFDEMPDNAQICNCNGVSKGAIMQCVADGKRSLKAVLETTRAGMGCGSCKTIVGELFEWACNGHVQVGESPALHRVPSIALAKPDPVETIREQNLKSESLSVAESRRIAGLVEKHQTPMVNVAGDQRIELAGISKQDLPAPGARTKFDEMPDNLQICNCNGVNKGAIVRCVGSGKRSLKAVMETTRAGKGCGSCKAQVGELVQWACKGQVEEDPALHYYVPGIPLAKRELVKAIREHGLKSVSAVFNTLAEGRDDPASKPGLASLLQTIWPDDYEDERDARFVNDRVHANIQNDGTFSVVPRIYGGVTSPAELRRIADVAEKYQARMVKITGGQRIDLLGIRKQDLPAVWRELGMPSGHAYKKAFRTCKTCVGTDFCRYAVGDSTQLGIRIEKQFQGIESPHKLKLAASGCPRNCAEATVKDVGTVAVENGWQVYVGGAAGSTVRAADLLATVKTQDEVLNLIGRFIQYYRENARYAERSYGFVERIGIQRLKAILVEDSEGEAARLDQEIKAAIAAYRDPWAEGRQPYEPSQFAEAAPIDNQIGGLAG